ncbi:SPOR domain-containing protein [Phenylobacterium montanum]|uniref:SPOR domain-containing protein n=1 Tax=Phenylobacterium montanum TaxID=2823693 RepID=A0A975FY21_9CAUL|nr:SPOR domain-containing protein [Caulobacter sp. S6]QUD86948.1 SPOR domain-containing protein [Caulobacter sp. S6]
MGLARLIPILAVVAAAPVASAQTATEREAAARRLHDWTGLPARSVLAVSPEMAVALIGRGAPGKAAGRLDGVELQGEVLDEAFAQARGWRSMRLKVDLACRDGGATWARRMTVYPDHGRGGAGREIAVPAGWVRPKAEAYLGQVVSALCGSAVALNEETAEPLPAPAPEPARAAERAPPVLRPAMPLPAAPSAKPPVSAPAGGVSVQIAASPVQAEANAADKGAAQRLLAADPALRFHVEPALSGGRQVYRALVSGFPDRNAAQRWCASLRAAGGACFVR